MTHAVRLTVRRSSPIAGSCAGSGCAAVNADVDRLPDDIEVNGRICTESLTVSRLRGTARPVVQ